MVLNFETYQKVLISICLNNEKKVREKRHFSNFYLTYFKIITHKDVNYGIHKCVKL